MVVSIVQATRIKARIRVRNRQKAALRISRAARLYLGSKNLTSLRRKHAIAAGAKILQIRLNLSKPFGLKPFSFMAEERIFA